MSNPRRKFIKNGTLAAAAVTLLSKEKKPDIDVISCAAASVQLTGTKISNNTGKWSDKTNWVPVGVPASSDTILIANGHTVTFDLANTTVAGVSISAGGVLQFGVSRSATLQSTGNVVVEGILKMRPSAANFVHTLRFININEANFVGTSGNGMDVVDSDTGLWVMGAGKLDILGTLKTSWTKAKGSVDAGVTSFKVEDATGWQVGDEIVIVPTEKLDPADPANWEDATGVLTDSFMPKFERRIITSAITGNADDGYLVKFYNSNSNQALLYNHLAVTSNITSQALGTSSNRNWTAEVANLTRNVRIEGTKDANSEAYTAYYRAHIFIRSSAQQSIQFLQGRYLGPRNLQGGTTRPWLVQGRYGLHFHHCEDGSRGSIIEGCVLFDMGNRYYVPHVSHGITMKNNVAFNSLQEAFWWDFQELSHNTTWDGNLMAAIRLNGVDKGSTGMLLGEGDGNKAINNVAVYANSGELHNSGGSYQWQTDSEGVWVFENNMAHSCTEGISVWQNTGNNHTIIHYDSYNCLEGIGHGAYGNSYTYRFGHHYKSLVFTEATSGNTSGVVFQDIYFNAAGSEHCCRVVDSPTQSDPTKTNKYIKCVFRNYTTAAVQLASSMVNSNIEKNINVLI